MAAGSGTVGLAEKPPPPVGPIELARLHEAIITACRVREITDPHVSVTISACHGERENVFVTVDYGDGLRRRHAQGYVAREYLADPEDAARIAMRYVAYASRGNQ